MPTYYVADEEGHSMNRVDATNANEAADATLKEWDLIADPGFKLYVFEESKAETFELGLTCVPVKEG